MDFWELGMLGDVEKCLVFRSFQRIGGCGGFRISHLDGIAESPESLTILQQSQCPAAQTGTLLDETGLEFLNAGSFYLI